jgi:H/ACA ribonucleoprotein complex subunit 3
MAKILKCPKCDKYTMKKVCPKCKIDTVTVEPAKYNPKDKYGDYRRKGKEEK